MLNYLYGLFVCLLAMLTQGCGATGWEVRASLNRVDTIEEARKTFNSSLGDTYHSIVDARENAQLSGSN